MAATGVGGAGVMATTATRKRKANKVVVNKAVSKGVPHKVVVLEAVAANNKAYEKWPDLAGSGHFFYPDHWHPIACFNW